MSYRIIAADMCGEFASFEAADWPAFLAGAEAFQEKHKSRRTAFAAFNDDRACCCTNGLTEDERDELGL